MARTKGHKKLVSREGKRKYTEREKMECHMGNMFDRLEVHAAINNIVSEVV